MKKLIKVVGATILFIISTVATAQTAGIFRDCPDCPEMVSIPAGSFMMGSLQEEAGRSDIEGPVHQVSVAPFSMGRYEVTVGEFRHFVQETQYKTDAERNAGNFKGCKAWDVSDGTFQWRAGRHWDNTGFIQTERQPVVCVSWNDANAYAEWLSHKTGKTYRLPSEAEWEYAARGKTNAVRYWGNNPDASCLYANVADTTVGPGNLAWKNRHECEDEYFFTAPVGSYLPNAFGLYDMIGNAFEWTADNYHEDYKEAPTDGSAWQGNNSLRVFRGGSWNSDPRGARAAARDSAGPAFRISSVGFRLSSTFHPE